MTRIERSVEISRSPQEVFELLSDASSLTRWVTVLHEARNPPERLETGDVFEQTIRILGSLLHSTWEASNVEEPREIRYEAVARIEIPVRMVQTIRPAETGAAVELEVEYDLPGGIAGELLDRAFVRRRATRDADRSLDRLKRILEEREQPPEDRSPG